MSNNAQDIVRRAIKRTRIMTGIACAGLMVAVVAQLALQKDWHGLPFLIFAAAMAIIVAWHFTALWQLPADAGGTE